jgi:hypothetical protein
MMIAARAEVKRYGALAIANPSYGKIETYSFSDP